MIGRLIKRVTAWIGGLSRGWIVAGSAVLGTIVVVGSVGMYRVYNYVQHDNDFCMSCHLMSGPYNRFQVSAHRGLGCKACHRPNIVQRTEMALTQIIEAPESISHHAEVPKQICAECHINGNPKEWKLIANSAGHRLHLESKDAALKKIQCLDCHGAGIHQFAPSDKSCGKVGCHEGVKVQLGKMSNLAIHCTSCHDFNKPVEKTAHADSLKGAITPRGNDCLSCHAMRQQVADNMPPDEKHGGVCGKCHNPHEQKTPAEAVRSCTKSGCHERPDTITAMHRMLAAGVTQNCTTCHRAHTWTVKADACTACHTPEKLDAGMPAPRIKQLDTPHTRMSVVDAMLAPYKLALGMVQQVAQQVGGPGIPGVPFRHTPHRKVACRSCHDTDTGHGVLMIKTASDCSGCHHSQQNFRQCANCHAASKLTQTFQRTFQTTTSVSKGPVTKTLGFNHGSHTKLQCTTCHNKSNAMRAVPSCTSCHDDHHTAQRMCISCHTGVKQIAAHTNAVHVSCSGAGCHGKPLNMNLRAQRNVCLVCHTDKVQHEPQGDCASCHMIPKP